MKKVFLLILLCIFCSNVFAYDVSDDNLASVYSDKQEIYLIKQMYDELSGNKDDDDEIVYEEVSNGSSYWWPIGSVETTVVGGKEYALGEPVESRITSNFEFRYFNGVKESHGGIDIGATSGVDTNVIASRGGIVIYPTKSSKIDYINFDPDYNKRYCNKSNISYGNYVMIQHDDGNYTLYGHLSPNSINVSEGDVVDQGQVIAKMGSSGCSTGAHLHFEMRIGSQSYSSISNPLDYVDKDNPRPRGRGANFSGDPLEMATEVIEHYEGIACADMADEKNYMACYSSGDGVTTIGPGVVVESNSDLFAKYGYTNVSNGTMIPKDIVHQIKKDIIEERLSDFVYTCLSDAGIDNFKDYQIAALITRAYNNGPCTICDNHCDGTNDENFIDAYKRYNGKYSLDDMYSSKGSIWTDSMKHYIRAFSDGPILEGLQRRRVGEWVWFVTGEIDYFCDAGCFDPSKYSW